jgi:hypothetical protein
MWRYAYVEVLNMKTIIAGSRNIANAITQVNNAIKASGFVISEVISGTARGVDTAGENWAAYHGIPVVKFPANWDLYGKQAGYIRNNSMANYAEALIAVWDGKSRGTRHMISQAAAKGLKTYIWIV